MSDLISRSELINALKVHFDSCFREDGELLYSDHICTSDDVADLIKLVENQPTAYDVEKVVAELEEEKEISCADFTKYVNEYNPCLDDEYDDFFHKGLERAIEVIRKGGAE